MRGLFALWSPTMPSDDWLLYVGLSLLSIGLIGLAFTVPSIFYP
jgi:hypothetical protein